MESRAGSYDCHVLRKRSIRFGFLFLTLSHQTELHVMTSSKVEDISDNIREGNGDIKEVKTDMKEVKRDMKALVVCELQ